MGWVLVTGGVAADIGKGTCAAVLARWWARSAGPVDYRKVEPCLQGPLHGVDNAHFGDVIETETGAAFDTDVGRAAFLVPGFVPDPHADTSLGDLLATALAKRSSDQPALRLVPTLASSLCWPKAARRVIEVGGTMGEPEHNIVVQTILLALGPPSAHLHVTCSVTLPGGRVSTKAAQVGLAAACHPPDVVFLRGEGEAQLAAGCPVPVVSVLESHWPVASWSAALHKLSGVLRRRLGLAGPPETQTTPSAAAPIDIALLTDVAGEAGYAMLCERLLGWSGGRVRLVPPETPGAVVVRVGERPPPASPTPPALEIVPLEHGMDPRDPAARPDWMGTLDSPAGAVADLLERLGALAPRTGPPEDDAPLAYADPAWAAAYLAHSSGGALRDHALLDALMLRALPGPDGLSGRRVVDLGCGDGRFSAMLVEREAEVVGVEVSPPMAAAALARQLPSFRLIPGSVEAVELPGPFDYAVAPCSFDHVVDINAALRNVADSLRPGGRLVLSTEHPLRTATPPGARWTDDGAARVRDYDQRGPRAYAWFGRPEPIVVQHRTVGDWVEAIERAGLRLRHVAEPAAADDAGVPRFWLLVAEKPGQVVRRITIDGPAGAGKSTLGCAVAEALGWLVFDTGQRARLHAGSANVVPEGHVVALNRDESDSVRFEGWACPSSSANGRKGLEGTPRESRMSADSRVDNAVLAELHEAMKHPSVLVGRGLGPTVEAGLRVWLDAPLAVRAERRRVAPEDLRARDDADRERGRLLEPDLLALELDGRRPLPELVDEVTRAWKVRSFDGKR